MPEFSFDRVTVHAPEWLRWLAPYVGQPGIEALEIGSAEGRSALWFLDNILAGPGSRIHCVDPFPNEGSFHCFQANTAEAQAAGRLRLTRAPSSATWLSILESTDLPDVIYVDGHHHEAPVFNDLVNAWYVLKPGGLLMVDDTALAAAPHIAGGPGPAVLRFLQEIPIHAELFTSSTAFGQMALRKLV
jgi:predicted O-methyltransferase YrrM